MFKKEKYQGEIWFDRKKEDRKFCVLSFRENRLTLETNLIGETRKYKENIIYGEFIGLGCLTFINNMNHGSTSGIVDSIIYKPEYTFAGNHHIDPLKLLVNHLYVVNPQVINWIHHHFFDFNYDTNRVDMDDEVEIITRMEKLDFTLELKTGTEYKYRKDGLDLNKYAYLNFKFDENQKFLTAIDLYNRF